MTNDNPDWSDDGKKIKFTLTKEPETVFEGELYLEDVIVMMDDGGEIWEECPLFKIRTPDGKEYWHASEVSTWEYAE